jgi:DNA polymerase III sliding clamp (beta) subunit (PCNA family)
MSCCAFSPVIPRKRNCSKSPPAPTPRGSYSGTPPSIPKSSRATYPDYTKVLPSNLGEGIEIGRSDLLNAARRVNLIADHLSIEIKGQSLTIRSIGSKDLPGDAVETLLIPKSKDSSMRLDANYVIDALESIDDETIQLFPVGPNAPLVIKTPKRSWTCVTAALTDADEKAAADKKAEEKKEDAKK